MRLLLATLLILGAYSMYACDICGCAASGNYYYGIFPNYQKHFAGIRYKFSSYYSTHPDDNTFGTDYFHTTEVWGRYALNKKIQFYIITPFQYTERIEREEKIHVNGVGDIAITGNYIILNTSEKSNKRWKHFTQLGGGIKLPTGKNNIIQNKQTLPNSLQLGSGSFDLTFNSIYIIRYKKYGLNINLNYRLNTTNSMLYKNGDQLNTSANLFYWINKSRLSFIPHIGIDFEKKVSDIAKKKKVDYTGGKSILANTGIDIFYQKLSLGCYIQKPIYEYINEGQTTSSLRLTTQLNYYF